MAGWYDSNWKKRFKITTDSSKVSGVFEYGMIYDLSNAPDDFWNDVKEDGGDIRVTRADGTTEVPRGIRDFRPVDSQLDVAPSGGQATIDWGSIFDINRDIFLKTVDINAGHTGTLTILFVPIDNFGDDITSITPVLEKEVVISSTGLQTVTINETIPEGRYWIGRDPTTIGLDRNASGGGVSSDANTVSVLGGQIADGSNTNAGFYWYFQWEFDLIDSPPKEGFVYFKAEGLSASEDVDFYIYYDNDSATDYANDATYGMQNVWHPDTTAAYIGGLVSDVLKDEGQSGNDAPLSSGVIENAAGVIGTGLNSITGWVDVPEITLGGGGGTAGVWTFMFWGNVVGRNHGIYGESGWASSISNPNIEFVNPAGNDTFRMWIRNTSGTFTSNSQLFSGGDNFNDGNWHHIAVKRGGDGVVRSYLDSTAKGSRTLSADDITAIDTVIGERIRYMNRAQASAAWNGLCDEFVIMKTELSADQIATIYNIQNDLNDFWTVGSIETGGVFVTVCTDFAPATAAETVDSTGDIAWTTPNNVLQETGSAQAASDAGNPVFSLVSFGDDTAPSGENKDGTAFTSVFSTSSYGADDDLWDLSLTAADVNSDDFSFYMQGEFGGTATTEYLRISKFGFDIPVDAPIVGLKAEITNSFTLNFMTGVRTASIFYVRISVCYEIEQVFRVAVAYKNINRLIGGGI